MLLRLWVKKILEVFLNVFSEFAEFSDKKFSLQQKDSNPSHLLCLRPACYQSSSQTHVRDKVFKLSSIHVPGFIRFPEFAEFSESSSHLGKTLLICFFPGYASGTPCVWKGRLRMQIVKASAIYINLHIELYERQWRIQDFWGGGKNILYDKIFAWKWNIAAPPPPAPIRQRKAPLYSPHKINWN